MNENVRIRTHNLLITCMPPMEKEDFSSTLLHFNLRHNYYITVTDNLPYSSLVLIVRFISLGVTCAIFILLHVMSPSDAGKEKLLGQHTIQGLIFWQHQRANIKAKRLPIPEAKKQALVCVHE